MPADQLSLTFAALAGPTRRAILTRLAEGEATVNEVAEPFPISKPAISRQLKVLERAGLVVRSREAQRRPSRMRADPLDEAVDWMQARKRTWHARIDRLDAHLRRKETNMSDSTAGTADEQVLITRIFDAPREQVFKAWTDPDDVAVCGTAQRTWTSSGRRSASTCASVGGGKSRWSSVVVARSSRSGTRSSSRS
jgi:DNA-binding transcriptional ArsR family regulator